MSLETRKPLSAKCACGVKAFPSEEAAEIALAKIQALGLRDNAPDRVARCPQNLWHLDDGRRGATLERHTEIPQQSKKRQAENRTRKKVAYATFGRDPICSREGCNQPAWDCHEPLTRGRGGAITDPANMAPLCRRCHDELTNGEPEWAYKQGLLVHSWDRGDAA